MNTAERATVTFQAAGPVTAARLSPLIYDSSHELLDFMFRDRRGALRALDSLLSKPNGHFGYNFATVMLVNGSVAGVELGYDRAQLAAQELPGAINTLRATPVGSWLHLLTRVNRALNGYVPPPSERAYYINNIAVDSSQRGSGLGSQFLDHVANTARQAGYTSIELDVTEANEAGIRFYQRYGFYCTTVSGSAELLERYGLPRLKRMCLPLTSAGEDSANGLQESNSPTVVNDVTRLNPIHVDEVYAPGTVEQLQHMLRMTDKPISIGGGRFSMGGQTAAADSLHIDMRGLNRVVSIDPEAKLIRVEAGARWRQIQNVISKYGLAVKVMQTYADFTVGGSISVNCHGRYIGLGPLIFSLRSLRMLMHDGEEVRASPTENSDIFFASVGGYGALGIIVEAELELTENVRIERVAKKMRLVDYPAYFSSTVRDNAKSIFHNADLVPPHFTKVRAITWQQTEKPVNRKERTTQRNLYLAEKYMLWAITETPAGHFRREYIYEPLLYLRPKITTRNDEANYYVAELEPLSRNRKTYVLQEYFVPVAKLHLFSTAMASILKRFKVQVVNVSVRHAHADPGSLMAWAREEVFALVLYYKQGTSRCDRERVAVWTRELIDAVLQCDGAYYLPYQPHARLDQFKSAYPNADKLFAMKETLDPHYRFRNCLWEKYYRQDRDKPYFEDRGCADSEFLSVYGDVCTRDAFYRFLQTIYHLYPEHKFHQLIIDACERHGDDRGIYETVSRRLPDIKPLLSEISYALPALLKQKKEMTRQTVSILPSAVQINGYLEIGSTGRYVKSLRRALRMSGPVFLTNEAAPDNSLPEIMERGGFGTVGEFFDLDDYAPINPQQIPDESVDLVSCYIGLHHCPREKLAAYIASIRRVLRPGGHFVLRDHNADTEALRTFCSLVHTVFNAGLGVPWEEDRKELRLFEGVGFWVNTVTEQGFTDSGVRLLQENDSSLNTLLCFTRNE